MEKLYKTYSTKEIMKLCNEITGLTQDYGAKIAMLDVMEYCFLHPGFNHENLPILRKIQKHYIDHGRLEFTEELFYTVKVVKLGTVTEFYFSDFKSAYEFMYVLLYKTHPDDALLMKDGEILDSKAQIYERLSD